MPEIRVRFAPSPTGYLHIGGARTAIFNYLFARQNNGKFILRIEDTDIDRSLADSESKILEDMSWLGINWDEGPDKCGRYGPYRQTQRLGIYREYAEKLLEQGKAYRCYCTPEELEEKRKKSFETKTQSGYDGTCRNLAPEEIEKFKAEGRTPAIRFRSSGKDITVEDYVKGPVEFKADTITDFVILKSDGTASYNFAVVIDDAFMKITHVIRGDEHLINTPRQVMLYEALFLPLPVFAHIPMILAPDHTKLSKRHGTTSVGEFREKGYLAQALVNYLALLGWPPPEGKGEFFTMQELVELFSLDKVAKNPAIYDIEKLKWMNSHYIKKLTADEIAIIMSPYLVKAGLIDQSSANTRRDYIKEVADLLKNYISYFEEAAPLAADFFTDEIRHEDDARALFEDDKNKEIIAALKNIILNCVKVDETNYRDIMKQVSDTCNVKGKDLYMPVRAALTGKLHGPELVKIFKIFGVKKAVSRIEEALNSALER